MVSLVSHVGAQQDPLGMADDIFGADDLGGGDELFAEPAADNEEDGEQEPDSPFVRQLNELAGRGNSQLAQAINSFARIGRWQDVDRLMRVLGGRGLPQPELAKMGGSIGADILLRMESQEEVKDGARNVIAAIRAALKAESESVTRLRNAIDQLDASATDVRLEANRTLLAGGNVAIAELVAAAVQRSPPAPRDDILRVMLRLGSGGQKALRQLALYGQPEARRFAVESLARINRSAAMTELITALHAADASQEEIDSASEILKRRSSSLPSLNATVTALAGELRRLGDIAQGTPQDNRVTVLWIMNEDGRTVTHQPTPLVAANYRDAADAATRLRRIGSYSAPIERDVLSADLAYRLMVDPDWGDEDQIQAVRTSFGASARSETILAAIGESLKRNDYPAVIGLLRLIDRDDTVDARYELLQSAGPDKTSLVKAASAFDPQVRYEAATVIGSIAGEIPFAGRSLVKQTLSEMRSLKDDPMAILVETRKEVISHLESLLSSMGLEVVVVGSVAEVQRLIAAGGDIRLILSKTELIDYPAVEMVDLVRRAPRGREVPIVFYGAEAPAIEQKRWDTPTVKIDIPRTSAAFREVMTSVERHRRLPPLSQIDRKVYSLGVEKMLAEMNSRR